MRGLGGSFVRFHFHFHFHLVSSFFVLHFSYFENTLQSCKSSSMQGRLLWKGARIRELTFDVCGVY